MKYSSDQPVAMILPLPVASPEKRIGVRFINLKSYANFFADMNRGFPVPVGRSSNRPMMMATHSAARPIIHVELVGDFIASYVPTLNDFDRVDPRFRLPRSVWDKIPAYADYGFAVFQLKGTASSLGVHPMAFEFHTRFPDTLYFPTVHIHDEQVHPVEAFDHSLYFQDPRVSPEGRGAEVSGPLAGSGVSGGMLRTSTGPAANFVDCGRTQGAVDPGGSCYKVGLRGELPNVDTLVRVG